MLALCLVCFCFNFNFVLVANADLQDAKEITGVQSDSKPTTSSSTTDTERKFNMKKSGMSMPVSGENLEDFIEKMIGFMAVTIPAIAVLGVMYGGVILMTAYGDSGRLDQGKMAIRYSLYGLAFMLLAYIIVSFVQTFVYNIDTY